MSRARALERHHERIAALSSSTAERPPRAGEIVNRQHEADATTLRQSMQGHIGILPGERVTGQKHKIGAART